MKQLYCQKFILLLYVGFSLLTGLPGCTLPPPESLSESGDISMVRVLPQDYPVFEDDMFYDGLPFAAARSLSYLARVPSARKFKFGQDIFTASHMVRSLENFIRFTETRPSPPDLQRFIASNFLIYRSVGAGKPGQVLFTGYYEPLLHGSLHPSPQFNIPVQARPADLLTIDLSLFSPEFNHKKIIGRFSGKTVLPYYTRQEIDTMGLMDNAVKIAWVQDPVALFFLQIQGSGKILLDNGDILNVHYDISNGRPYRSIGKLLLEQGKIPRSKMSMQEIRAYLWKHPEEMSAILNYNPSYVFFKVERDGPVGYLDVKLTAGRSLALDRHLFPLAALAFVETKKPLVDGAGQIRTWDKMRRFVFNQDTGGAIRGPGRADLFWGNGPYAAIAAGHMQHGGTLHFLILKPDR
ncbi:MAG: MltA domain-containing protein [Desulfobacterales bacterium]|nr:MltA domain-containing protein [Desulfobacterales bacterium]